MMTRSQETRLVAVIEQAVKSNGQPLAIDAALHVSHLRRRDRDRSGRGRSARHALGNVCGSCFELFRICPGPRPME
jgi:hypothetical protein